MISAVPTKHIIRIIQKDLSSRAKCSCGENFIGKTSNVDKLIKKHYRTFRKEIEKFSN